MSCRPYGRKPTIALWMLVAVADLAALVAATGPLTMFLILAGLFVLVGGVVAARPLIRRFADAREVVARRRA